MHKDGSKHENIRALVDKGRIFIGDATLPLTAGDRIQRKLPSGQIEVFRSTNVHLWKGSGNIQSYYEVDYEREDATEPQSRPSTVNVQISDSPQTHITLNSIDKSTSVIDSQSRDVFSEIRGIIEDSLADSDDLSLLLEKVHDMERSRDTGDFKRAYKDFVAAVADHITLFTPVLPVLSAML